MKLTRKPNLCAILSVTFAMIAITSASLHAQMTAEPFSYNTDITPSVETWKMTRHGSLRPSLHTGSMSYSLPLYTYTDEDFSIPMSLEYSYSGFRPSVHSGAVALGWTLNCGGAITREVRGLPDEITGASRETDLNGYWQTIRDGVLTEGGCTVVTGKIMNRDRVETPSMDPYNFDLFTDEPYMERPNGSRYDLCPDLFHFNFLGNTGEFMIGTDGKIHVFNTSGPFGEYSVEADMYKYDRLQTPEFTITTGDGYKYIFGGTRTSTEYNAVESESPDNVTVSAWRLRRIESPNGNHVDLVFDGVHQRDISVLKAYSPVIEGVSLDSFQYQRTRYERRGSSSYYPLLKAVVVNSDTLIRLSYRTNTHDENGASAFDYAGYDHGECRLMSYSPTRSLSGISVVNSDGRQIESVRLSKTTVGSSITNSRVLLKSVTGLSFGRYTFDYTASSIPYNDTNDLDHWGYWNGKRTTGLITNLNYTDIKTGGLYEQFNPGFTGKNPDIYYAGNCAMTRITYPTGGHTDIGYEQNTAGYLIDRSLGSILDITRNTAGFIPGGMRVKSLTTVSDGTSRTITYEYLNGASRTSSSGILMRMPRYAFSFGYVFYVNSNPYDLTAVGYSSECFQPCTAGDPEVAYSDVRERYPDGSWIDYRFSTWDDFPDVFMTDLSGAVSYEKTPVNSEFRIGDSGDDEDYSYIRRFLLPAKTDYRSRRGKLVSQKEYGSDGSLVRETTNSYTVRTEMTQSMVFNTFVDFTRMDWQFVSTYLQSTYDRRYDDNGVDDLMSVSGFTYNDLGQKATESVNDGSTGHLTTHYRYYGEEHETCPPHLRSAVTKTARTKSTDDGSYVLSVEHLDYGVASGNPRPVSITHYAPEIPYPENAGSVFAIPAGSPTRDAAFEYNSLFRPVRVNLPGEAFITYEWDSGGTHIISKTVNGGAYKWEYGWLDMVGLQSVKGPEGRSTTYGYDGRNRLNRVMDPKGHTTVTYMYHLNNE